MKDFLAAALFMTIVFVVLTREVPGPSQPLLYRINAELGALKYLPMR